MCLFTDDVCASIAKSNITCYKVVKMTACCFISKYRGFTYNLGEEYTENSFEETIGITGIVRHGFHSYRTLKEAQDNCWLSYVLLKCVIPKNARYYISKDKKEYCSNSIKIIAWKPCSKWNNKII